MLSQSFPYPVAPGAIPNCFSTTGLQPGTEAKGKKLIDDLSLRRDRDRAAAAASPGILHGEMKRRGAGFVFQQRVTACPEQDSNRSRASGSHRPVQRSCAVLVLQINVRACID